ncbi:metallophosphoesterase family protein [Deinococcus maricopensis]|uniref:Metallophosphoesterase n=1 Tax=Deinococcus maricopensis (strain DSM 21211 / LMG 22137 / NRRL B-23946 / LB-34) TaxID=709986 RepID=E8U7J0_DEIML|nr:metallophosphoesterase [Deinococcus maricopensis]ADV67029.1 metallophosphoesterase [Deinococcus maricopensis DSM 21211]
MPRDDAPPTYRVAVMADVHGNLQALQAALADARARGYDELVVNGDVVNRGPDSVAALERLLGAGVTFTLGNHDDLMVLWQARSDALPAEWFDDPFWRATAWSAAQLDQAGLLPELRRWPMTHRVDLPGAPRVLIAHGTPDHYREPLSGHLDDARHDALLDAHGADVLVGSHIHVPYDRHVGPRRWLNTGAVGSPFNRDPRAQYLTLDLHGDAWTPTFQAVPYDRDAALRAYDTSGLAREGGLSAAIFREEVQLARSLYTPFWDWTEARALRRDEAAWAEFRALHPERFEP